MGLSWDDLRISQRKQGFLGLGLFVWHLCQSSPPGETTVMKYHLSLLKRGRRLG